MKNIIRRLYDIIPFKREIFCLIKYLKPSENIFKHLHFKGVFKVKLSSTNSFKMFSPGTVEENQLFWKGIEGGWEKKSIEIWRKLCEKSATIFDIGANTGIYSLVAKSVNPNSSVYAFEPLPGVVKFLRKNNDINNFNISINELAVSNFTGEAKVFMEADKDFAYSVTVNKSLLSKETPQKEIPVKTITLKDYIENNMIKKIDLIKIDVETHEPEVLEGFGNYLKIFKPDIIIEVWSENTIDAINLILKDSDYMFFDIDDKNEKITQKDKVYVSSYWNYLVCKKETAKYLGLI